MTADPDPPDSLPGRISEDAAEGPAASADPSPPVAVTHRSVGENATELDLSFSSPVTVRPGIKRATLTVELEGEGDLDGQSQASGASEKDLERSAADYLGYIIDGRYHVQSIIAHGGMGVVYLCRHRTIDKAVAVKILRPDMASDREVTERFLVEARAASSIGNRHIIDVTDFGELPDGATYLVMEYLEGISLANRLRHPEVVSVAQILNIGEQIAEGLQAAHEAGIVHRDLKPDNIFLCEEQDGHPFVKILDFGIAKVASSQNKVTRAGKIFGTPHYMAPEQGAGTPVDQRTDIYSLGVMLYELACGQVPFDAENPIGILTQHMYVAPIPPNERPDATRTVPIGLEAVILKCMSKDPEHRYRSMLDLYSDLDRVERGDVPQAVADLLARDSDELPLKRLRTASIAAGAKRNIQSPGTWLGLSLTALLVAVLVGVTFFPRNDAFIVPDESPTPAIAAEAGSKDKPAASKAETYTVALVLAPIDAHVFDGTQDLGTMPISLQLHKGELATLHVRRDGFVSQSVVIDGTRSKLIVELEPIPGVELETPVPVSHPGMHHLGQDAGTRIVVLHPPESLPVATGDAGVRPASPARNRPSPAPLPAAPVSPGESQTTADPSAGNSGASDPGVSTAGASGTQPELPSQPPPGSPQPPAAPATSADPQSVPPTPQPASP